MNRAWCLVGLVVLFSGCGDDDTEGGTGGSGNAGGTGAQGGAGNDGGMGGSGAMGGAGGSGGEPVPEAYTEACIDLHEASCAAYFTCAPHLAEYDYADEADCVVDRVAACEAFYRSDGASGDDIQGCLAALDLSDCTAEAGLRFFGPAWPDFPAACAYSGDRSDGDACELGAQCASGFCSNYDGTEALCGTCVAAGALDMACDDGVCEVGLACVSGTCVLLGDLNDPCDADNPCRPRNFCDNGTCSAWLGDGDPCDVNNVGCGSAAPFCNVVTNQCEDVLPAAAIGDTCWIDAVSGSAALCANGLCQVNFATGEGTCIAPKHEGDACTAANNIFRKADDCDWSLLCFAGTCQYAGDVLVCE